jgi:DNA-binding SARP family transcriptional activator
MDQAHTRQQLAFQFWPDSTEAQARTNLRKAIYHLRHKLPNADRYLSIERQTISWRADSDYTLDTADFERIIALAESARKKDQLFEVHDFLEQAVVIYRGELLPGYYDDWILAAREHLHQKYLVCLEELILCLESERRYPTAIRYAQKLLRADPLHEATYRRLIRLQALNGNISGALRTFHDCTSVLHRELSVQPSLGTRETYERLLKMETRVEALPDQVPLVARASAWNGLQNAWREITQKPRVLLLTGEAGIGKTRLADEFLDWAGRQGITTLAASCYPSGGRLPYGPIINWLRSETFEPILRALEDRWLTEISRLLPELLVSNPDLDPPNPLKEDWQRQHFFAALSNAIVKLPLPLLLFLDDLQWCDQETLDWLHFLLHFDESARFLLLGAVRTEEVQVDHPLEIWRRQLDHENRFGKISLNRLDSQSTSKLAALVTRKTLEVELASRLYLDTEGIPLFIVEIARAGFQLTDPDLSSATGFPTSVSNLPDKVRTVIETRLMQLSESAQRLTHLAAAIGRSFTFDLLAQASGQDQENLVRDLDELWQRRIIRERGPDSYDFSHDKIRQVVYTNLSAARRRLYHLRIAMALTKLHQDDLDPVSSQLAAHYEAAGQFDWAIRHYQQAAELSRRIFANQETQWNLRRAIALLSETGNDDLATELHEALGDVLALTSKSEAAHRAFEAALLHTDSPWVQSRLYRKIADTLQVRCDFKAAFQAWDRSEEELDVLSDKNEETWQREWLQIQLDRMWGHYWASQVDELDQLVEQIKTPIEKYGTLSQRGLYYQRLNLLSLRKYRYVIPDESVEYARISLAAIEESGDMSQIPFARFMMGFAHLWHGWGGDLEQAETFLQDALQLAEKVGDSVVQVRCLNYLLIVYRRQGQITGAKSLLPRALDLAKITNLIEYEAYVNGGLSWVAYREGDFSEAQASGQRACELIEQFTRVLPVNWIVYWPMLGMALSKNKLGEAVTFAQGMLEPSQHRFPDELNNLLQGAINAWENKQFEIAQTCLEASFQMAYDFGYM